MHTQGSTPKSPNPWPTPKDLHPSHPIPDPHPRIYTQGTQSPTHTQDTSPPGHQPTPHFLSKMLHIKAPILSHRSEDAYWLLRLVGKPAYFEVPESVYNHFPIFTSLWCFLEIVFTIWYIIYYMMYCVFSDRLMVDPTPRKDGHTE